MTDTIVGWFTLTDRYGRPISHDVVIAEQRADGEVSYRRERQQIAYDPVGVRCRQTSYASLDELLAAPVTRFEHRDQLTEGLERSWQLLCDDDGPSFAPEPTRRWWYERLLRRFLDGAVAYLTDNVAAHDGDPQIVASTEQALEHIAQQLRDGWDLEVRGLRGLTPSERRQHRAIALWEATSLDPAVPWHGELLVMTDGHEVFARLWSDTTEDAD